MKENIEDISADIELQYGQANMERNIAYVLSLVEAHVTEDGRLDDDVPVPSIEAVVKTILLLVDRPELSWETICREQRVKHVMEYLFIRARNHPDEVHGFVDRLLKQYVPEIPSQMVRIYHSNLSSKMTHSKLILLGAVIEFIEAYDTFDINVFNQWMRVVWNIVENTNIDSLTPVSSLIRKLSAVIHNTAIRSSEGLSFYAALSQWKDDNNDERENRALLEEIEKAKRISENNDWLDLFIQAEKHPFFKGMVLFFYESGLSLDNFNHRYELAKGMFDENGISELYRKDHMLIRAIVSQFNSWDDLKERYVTERAESNKYLKNILASHESVRNMFSELLNEPDESAVERRLHEYIEEEKEFISWNGGNDGYCDMAVKRLRKDIKLYDWIAAEERQNKSVFRIYWYEGHIMFAVLRKQYAKVALDTERAKTAYKIAENYGMDYYDNNQLQMYKKYGDSFGNEIWLKQDRQNCILWIGFCQYHELRIQIECKTKKYAKELLEVFEGSTYIDDDERWIKIPYQKHFKYQKTYRDLAKVLENIFEKIPEL